VLLFGIKVLKTSGCSRQFIFHCVETDKMTAFFGYLCPYRGQFDVVDDVMS